MFDAENVYIQNDPDRLAIFLADSIVYIPWERIIAFAVEVVAPEPLGLPQEEDSEAPDAA